MPNEISPDGVIINKETPDAVQPNPDVNKEVQVNNEKPVVNQEVPKPEVETPDNDGEDALPVVNFDEFINRKEEPVNELAKKEDELTSTPKPEAKETKNAEAPNKTTEQQKQTGRDYSGLTDEEIHLFKSMSNDSFNKLKPIFLAHKSNKAELDKRDARIAELEKGEVKLPDSYYENPHGVILHPDFIQANQLANKAQFIANHWRKQLQNIREGKSTYSFIDINPETGEFTFTDKPSDAAAEVDVLEYFTHAQNQFARFKGKAESMIENHAQRHQSVIKWINEFENTSFPWYNTNEELKKVVDGVVNNFHPSLRANPIIKGYAKAIVMIHQLGNTLQKMKENGGTVDVKNKAGKVSEQQGKAGPTAADAGASGKNGSSPDEITFDSFLQRKEQTE